MPERGRRGEVSATDRRIRPSGEAGDSRTFQPSGRFPAAPLRASGSEDVAGPRLDAGNPRPEAANGAPGVIWREALPDGDVEVRVDAVPAVGVRVSKIAGHAGNDRCLASGGRVEVRARRGLHRGRPLPPNRARRCAHGFSLARACSRAPTARLVFAG
jgi:hypothetical protein